MKYFLSDVLILVVMTTIHSTAGTALGAGVMVKASTIKGFTRLEKLDGEMASRVAIDSAIAYYVSDPEIKATQDEAYSSCKSQFAGNLAAILNDIQYQELRLRLVNGGVLNEDFWINGRQYGLPWHFLPSFAPIQSTQLQWRPNCSNRDTCCNPNTDMGLTIGGTSPLGFGMCGERHPIESMRYICEVICQ